MKAITVFKETEEQLRAELIKAVPAMVVGHRDYEQPATQPHHLHAVGYGDGKVKNMLDGPRVDDGIESALKLGRDRLVHVVQD